jgi:hypothetical protein
MIGCVALVTTEKFAIDAANVVPSSAILVTIMMEAPRYPETSVLIRASRHNIPQVGSLHSHRRENLKSYIVLTVWAL